MQEERHLSRTPTPNGRPCRSPSGYVAGRVMPARPPPSPGVTSHSVQWSSSKAENQATFITRENEQWRETEAARKRRRKVKNSLVCVSICLGLFFIVLAVVFGTNPGSERDGK